MSDCSWGANPYRHRWGDQQWHEPRATPEPRGGIHGAVRWADGTQSELHYAREVNGVERVPARVVMDGVDFLPAPRCTMARTKEGYPCHDWTCSACGKVHAAAWVMERCPRCGALTDPMRVVDESGEPMPRYWFGNRGAL